MEADRHEQRLVLRVLAQWQALCAEDALPRRSQIDPAHFGKDWMNCLLIDIDPRSERSRFAFVGDRLRDPSWPTLERQAIGDCQENTLLHLATSYIPRVLSKGVPVSTGGVGIHQSVPIVYRSILLPLSEGDGRIDGVLGAANYREIPVTVEIHPFREHPFRALAVAPQR